MKPVSRYIFYTIRSKLFNVINIGVEHFLLLAQVYTFSGDGHNTAAAAASTGEVGYGGGMSGNASAPPRQAFSINLGESVRSLDAGRVSSDAHPEVVACTFGGRVCSLTTQALRQVTKNKPLGTYIYNCLLQTIMCW